MDQLIDKKLASAPPTTSQENVNESLLSEKNIASEQGTLLHVSDHADQSSSQGSKSKYTVENSDEIDAENKEEEEAAVFNALERSNAKSDVKREAHVTHSSMTETSEFRKRATQ